MAVKVLRGVSDRLLISPFYAIMADEATNSASKEQVVVVLRWVDTRDFTVHEDFIGLYDVASTRYNSLVSVIKDTLCRLNLSVMKCRGQCNDETSNMSGVRNGVASQIRREEPRAIYMHCYNSHSLNFATADAIKNFKLMKSSVDTAHKINKLIKYFSRRDAIFQRLKLQLACNDRGSVRVLCPTRWTVRADPLHSIISNWQVLTQL